MKKPEGTGTFDHRGATHLSRGVARVATDAVVGSRFGLPRTIDELDTGSSPMSWEPP
jgi:hypothetical protein